MSNFKVAILDLNNGFKSLGLSSMEEILCKNKIEYRVFDVRKKSEFPGLEYDFYISTGGPGDPRSFDSGWYKKYEKFLDTITTYNKKNKNKKQLLLICLSFQLACRYLKIGTLSKRFKTSYGIYDIKLNKNQILEHKIAASFLHSTKVLDFRNFQVTPKDSKSKKILALEEAGKEFGFKSAVMAYAFTPDILGVQFHPEICLDKFLEKHKENKGISGEFEISKEKVAKIRKKIIEFGGQILHKNHFEKIFVKY